MKSLILLEEIKNIFNEELGFELDNKKKSKYELDSRKLFCDFSKRLLKVSDNELAKCLKKTRQTIGSLRHKPFRDPSFPEKELGIIQRVNYILYKRGQEFRPLYKRKTLIEKHYDKLLSDIRKEYKEEKLKLKNEINKRTSSLIDEIISIDDDFLLKEIEDKISIIIYKYKAHGK